MRHFASNSLARLSNLFSVTFKQEKAPNKEAKTSVFTRELLPPTGKCLARPSVSTWPLPGLVGVGQADGWLESTCQPLGLAREPCPARLTPLSFRISCTQAFALLGWGRSPLCLMHYLQSRTAWLSEAMHPVQTRADLSPGRGTVTADAIRYAQGRSGVSVPQEPGPPTEGAAILYYVCLLLPGCLCRDDLIQFSRSPCQVNIDTWLWKRSLRFRAWTF